MPGSIRENDADVIEFVKTHNIKTVMDVGPGVGTYSKLLRNHVEEIIATEVWLPYIEEFKLRDLYDRVDYADIRNSEFAPWFMGDLIIFGDVLEHMSREDSLKVWEKASNAYRYGLISIPIVHWPQGAEYDNPYEVHVQEHMHPEDVRNDYGPFVFDKEYTVTGTFIKEFN